MFPWFAIGIYFLISTTILLIIGFDAQHRGLKKEDVYGWMILAFIFSILALVLYIILICSKPILRAYCPKCGKPIRIEWKACPYCGQKLKREVPNFPF